MPTLDLQDDLYLNADGKPAVAHQARLCLRLQAYMAWPEDQVSRTQFLAANGARMMGNLLPIKPYSCIAVDALKFNKNALAF